MTKLVYSWAVFGPCETKSCDTGTPAACLMMMGTPPPSPSFRGGGTAGGPRVKQTAPAMEVPMVQAMSWKQQRVEINKATGYRTNPNPKLSDDLVEDIMHPSDGSKNNRMHETKRHGNEFQSDSLTIWFVWILLALWPANTIFQQFPSFPFITRFMICYK